MKRAISFRHLIALIVLLGLVISSVSLAAVVRVLSLTVAQRIERARDGVIEEAGVLALRPTDISLSSTLVGLRAGRAEEPASMDELPISWRPVVLDALANARRSSHVESVSRELERGVLVVAAQPVQGDRAIWVAQLVLPPTYLGTWRWVVEILAVTMALLVAVALYMVVTLRSGVASLHRSLGALSDDLHAPIARPALRELGEVADGIAVLADRLATAREHQERLSRELVEQQRLAALGRVVAGVAHEVRNPLASIKLRLDLVTADGGLSPAIERDLSLASSEIARLDTLVADLLAASGRSAGARRTVALGELVRTRVELLGPWISNRGVSVSIEGDARVDADHDAVARAVDNLVRNAIEASPRGGKVSITIASAASQAWIEISDEGDGVDEANVPRLFEPFFTTKPTGTGLGLAISLAVARAHGGDLTYVRRDATTFVFSIATPSNPRT